MVRMKYDEWMGIVPSAASQDIDSITDPGRALGFGTYHALGISILNGVFDEVGSCLKV
jgi:hypothetical protein